MAGSCGARARMAYVMHATDQQPVKVTSGEHATIHIYTRYTCIHMYMRYNQTLVA